MNKIAERGVNSRVFIGFFEKLNFLNCSVYNAQGIINAGAPIIFHIVAIIKLFRLFVIGEMTFPKFFVVHEIKIGIFHRTQNVLNRFHKRKNK